MYNNEDLQRMLAQAITKELDKQVHDYINENCDHVYIPTYDGTGDLICEKCRKRFMQTYRQFGKEPRLSDIDGNK